jgi:voltage-gated sodium channel
LRNYRASDYIIYISFIQPLLSTMKTLFNDKNIFYIILANVAVIYLHSFEFFHTYFQIFDFVDIAFTVYFTVEIGYKISLQEKSSFKSRFKEYLSDNWNKIDFFSVVLAIPSLGVLIIEDLEIFAGFTVLRSLRVFKFLRIIEYIPEGKRISKQLFQALRAIFFIIFAFVIYSTIISLISVSLFKSSAPYYFSNAFDSFFTIFKIFSGDGFSDVVAEIEANSSLQFIYFTKFYFVFIVFTGSILGLSLINSIFIDQMNQIAEKNDEQELSEIAKLKKEISELKEIQKEILESIKKH